MDCPFPTGPGWVEVVIRGKFIGWSLKSTTTISVASPLPRPVPHVQTTASLVCPRFLRFSGVRRGFSLEWCYTERERVIFVWSLAVHSLLRSSRGKGLRLSFSLGFVHRSLDGIIFVCLRRGDASLFTLEGLLDFLLVYWHRNRVVWKYGSPTRNCGRLHRRSIC